MPASFPELLTSDVEKAIADQPSLPLLNAWLDAAFLAGDAASPNQDPASSDGTTATPRQYTARPEDGTAGSVALQFRITDGQDVRAIVRRLASVQIVAIAQPNYIYRTLQEPAADPAAPASRGNPQQQGSAERQDVLVHGGDAHLTSSNRAL